MAGEAHFFVYIELRFDINAYNFYYLYGHCEARRRRGNSGSMPEALPLTADERVLSKVL
jgi:hypothetical protein